MAGYRLWVSDDGTVLVRLWESGVLEVAKRRDADAVWGPPIPMLEEKV
jgi:hypothetical protein